MTIDKKIESWKEYQKKAYDQIQDLTANHDESKKELYEAINVSAAGMKNQFNQLKAEI